MSRAMTNYFSILAAGAALLLGGCSNNDSDQGADPAPAPTVKVTELAVGTWAVSSGDVANPTAGKYYAGADGSRLLVLNNAEQLASAVYRRDGNGNWQASPGASSTLELINSNPAPSEPLALGAIGGSYQVRLSGGAVAAFTVNANGDIVAGSSACKLTGKMSASNLAGVLAVSLGASGCDDLPAQSSGFAVRDGDYAPAAFRLLTYTDTALADLWAYAE